MTQFLRFSQADVMSEPNTLFTYISIQREENNVNMDIY